MPPETMPLFPFMNALLKTFLEHQHWRARHNPMLSCMWALGKFLLTLHLRMEPPVPHSQEPGAWALEGGRRGGHLSLMPQGSEKMDLLQLILPLQTSPQTYTSPSVHRGDRENFRDSAWYKDFAELRRTLVSPGQFYSSLILMLYFPFEPVTPSLTLQSASSLKK